jgi:hypothetical protein
MVNRLIKYYWPKSANINIKIDNNFFKLISKILGMEEYRRKHAEQYMKRMKEQEEARMLELQKEQERLEAQRIEEERVRKVVDTVVQSLERTATAILIADSPIPISHSLSHTFEVVKEHFDTWSASETNKTIVNTQVIQLFENINTNQTTVVNLNKADETIASRTIQNVMKELLKLCGIDDNLAVEIDMDCSRDEELARQLAATNPFTYNVNNIPRNAPTPAPVPITRARATRPRTAATRRPRDEDLDMPLVATDAPSDVPTQTPIPTPTRGRPRTRSRTTVATPE